VLPDITRRNAISKADEILWSDFRDHVQDVYRNNPFFLPDIEQWHSDLFARAQAGENLRLEYMAVQHRDHSDLTYGAFCLNRQMFFSQVPAVLTLPYPRHSSEDGSAVYSDKLVGVFLNDFGYDEEFFWEAKKKLGTLKEKARLYEEVTFNSSSYAGKILNNIQAHLNAPYMPGSKANQFTKSMLRYARLNPSGAEPHTDVEAMNDIETIWTRFAFHSLIGKPTLFNLIGNKSVYKRESFVQVPLLRGATSSYCAMRFNPADRPFVNDEWSIGHNAQACAEGRLFLFMGDSDVAIGEALKNEPFPWLMTPYSGSAKPAARPLGHPAQRPHQDRRRLVVA
jgi:hypothetical protein